MPAPLRDDVRMVGSALGTVLREQAGDALLTLVAVAAFLGNEDVKLGQRSEREI